MTSIKTHPYKSIAPNINKVDNGEII